MNINRLLIAALSIAAIAPAGWSQSFDDDIYYDASKAKKKETVAKKVRTTEPASFPAADTYAGELTSSTRDIDEYNRRGIFAVPDSVQADSLAKQLDASGDAFANTRRIERFYNPEVVIENPDATVAEYYYSDQPAEINIYVNNPYPFFGTAAMYYDPWFFGPGYYNPWYYGGFYNPWSWGWTPGHHRPIATRPQPPHGGNHAGSYRRAASASGGRYLGSGGSAGGTRPSTSSGSNWNIGNVGTRPGTSSGYRPGASGSNRGGGSATNATGRRPGTTLNNNRGTRNQNSYNNRNNTDRTYNRSTQNNSTYRSNSGGSMGGGSFRSGGGGGSFRSGGGGGGHTGGGGRRR